jgi:hypothetical protein
MQARHFSVTCFQRVRQLTRFLAQFLISLQGMASSATYRVPVSRFYVETLSVATFATGIVRQIVTVVLYSCLCLHER